MRKVTGIVIVGLVIVTAGVLLSAADAPPPWAYGFAGPAGDAPHRSGSRRPRRWSSGGSPCS